MTYFFVAKIEALYTFSVEITNFHGLTTNGLETKI